MLRLRRGIKVREKSRRATITFRIVKLELEDLLI